MTNYRSELQKLIASFDEHLGVHNDSLLRAVEEARASLDEPVAAPAGPTDDELLALVPQGSESDFYLPKGLPSNWDDGDFIAPPEAVVAFARAVLARWGHQSAPPTEDEVADLVAWLLCDEADQYDCIQQAPDTSHKLRRAAYLLEKSSQSKAVAEHIATDAEARAFIDDWAG